MEDAHLKGKKETKLQAGGFEVWVYREVLESLEFILRAAAMHVAFYLWLSHNREQKVNFILYREETRA